MLLCWLLSWIKSVTSSRYQAGLTVIVLVLVISAAFALSGEAPATVVIWVLVLLIGTTAVGWLIGWRPTPPEWLVI